MNMHKTMTRLEMLAGGLLKALLVAGFVLPTAAQQPVAQGAPAGKASVSQQEQEEPSVATNGPGHEGIRVHGHWILDLKDKDGNVIEHRDFQNALIPAGGQALTSVLMGAYMPSALLISASQSDTASQIYVMVPTGYANGLLCGSSQVPASHCFSGLTRTMNFISQPAGCSDPSCVVPANITLQGEFVAVAPISVDRVTTHLVACQALGGTPYPTVTPAQCVAGNSPGGTSATQFTGTTITPLSVAAGQTLAVTVVLSFT